MSLAARLWRDNADLAERILAHRFVRGLGDGTLPLDCFRRYVAQDAYFLEAFARAYAACLAASTSREALVSFSSLIAGVVDELKLHADYARRWDVELEGVTPVPATLKYTEFLTQVAMEGRVGETIAAMTPCMRLYAFLGQKLAMSGAAGPYAEWVQTYAASDFEALAQTLEKLLDRHAEDCQAVADNYRTAMKLEYDFFAANLD